MEFDFARTGFEHFYGCALAVAVGTEVAEDLSGPNDKTAPSTTGMPLYRFGEKASFEHDGQTPVSLRSFLGRGRLGLVMK
jgi:hypothetical protein